VIVAQAVGALVLWCAAVPLIGLAAVVVVNLRP